MACEYGCFSTLLLFFMINPESVHRITVHDCEQSTVVYLALFDKGSVFLL